LRIFNPKLLFYDPAKGVFYFRMPWNWSLLALGGVNIEIMPVSMPFQITPVGNPFFYKNCAGSCDIKGDFHGFSICLWETGRFFHHHFVGVFNVLFQLFEGLSLGVAMPGISLSLPMYQPSSIQ
jgi:hypothetical protein